MSSECKTLLLGDVYEYCSGLSKPRSEFGSGHPFLGFKDVFYNSAVPKVLSELVRSTPQEQNRCSIKRGDLFLTRTSETMDELGMSSVALKDYPNATFNGFTKRLRPKSSDVIAPEYARYYFRSTHFRQSVNAMSTMSTRASLNNEILDRLQVVLPPLQEQKCIGYLLTTLDDKIELNRKTNETLEAMAKALFKSWFVDFDPVRAKAEGRPTGLPIEISDLFPDSFEDSELGDIPSGWNVRRLRDFIKPVKDRQGDRNIVEYSATVTGIEPRDSRFKKNLSRSGDKNKVALEGDLVFGLSRRTINFGRMAQPIGAFSSVYEVFRSTSGSTISTKIIEQYIRLRMSEFMVVLKPAAREGQAIDREVLLE